MAFANAWNHWFNAKPLSDDYKKTLFDTPPMLNTIEHFLGLVHRHGVAPTYTLSRTLANNRGNFGMWISAAVPWGEQQAIGDQFEIDIAPTPVMKETDKRVESMFDQPHVVLAAAQRHNVLDEATRLVLFLAGDYVGKLFAELIPGGMPSKKTAINSPIFQKTPPPNAKRALDSFKHTAVSYPVFPGGVAQWLASWRPLLRKALDGELPPREFAQQGSVAGDTALSAP